MSSRNWDGEISGLSHADSLTWCTHTYLCRVLKETGKEQEMKPGSLSSCKVTLFPELLPFKGNEQGCTPSSHS